MEKDAVYLERLYFAYGSNLHLEQMARRCPDSVKVAPAVLHNYRLTFRGNYRGVGVADVVPCVGGQVVGGLYRISLRDLANLDRYEGFPTLYRRYKVKVETEDGEVEAFCYRMLPHFKPAPPADYYLGVIVEGYANWGFDPRPLIDSVESVYEELRGRSRSRA